MNASFVEKMIRDVVLMKQQLTNLERDLRKIPTLTMGELFGSNSASEHTESPTIEHTTVHISTEPLAWKSATSIVNALKDKKTNKGVKQKMMDLIN